MAKIKRVISVLSAVALCISLASCSGETSTKETPEQTAMQTYSDKTDEVTTVIQTVYVQPETHRETIYNHVALQGAVVIEQDGRPYFKYKKKCELCGYISSGSTGTSASSGKLNSSFHCPDCGNQQKIQIETIRQ